MEEIDDFTFRSRIEATGDLVTKEELGVGNQLHGEAKTSFLPPRKNAHGPVGNGSQSGFLENTVNAVVEIFGSTGFHAELCGGLDRFVDAELVISD